MQKNKDNQADVVAASIMELIEQVARLQESEQRSRENAIVLTKLEEALMWRQRGLARLLA